MKPSNNILAQTKGDLDLCSLHDESNIFEKEIVISKRGLENMKEIAIYEILQTENILKLNTENNFIETIGNKDQNNLSPNSPNIIDMSNNKTSILFTSNQSNKNHFLFGIFKNITIIPLKKIAKNIIYCFMIFCFSLFANNLLRRDILICLIYSEDFIRCEFWKKMFAMITSMLTYDFGHFLFGIALIKKIVLSKDRRCSILIAYTFLYTISHFIFLIPIYDETFEIPLFSILCLVTFFNGFIFIFLSLFMKIKFPLKKIKNYIFFEQGIIIVPGILTLLINKVFPLAFEHIKNNEQLIFIKSVLNSFFCIMMKFLLKATIFSNNEFIDVKVLKPGANMLIEFLSGFKIGSLMLLEIQNIYFWLDLSILTFQKYIEHAEIVKRLWVKFIKWRGKNSKITKLEKITSKRTKIELESQLSILFLLIFYIFSQIKIVYLFPSNIFDYKKMNFDKTSSGNLIPDIFSFEKTIIIIIFLINFIIIEKILSKKKKNNDANGEKNKKFFSFLELFYMFKYFTMFTGGIEFALLTFLEIEKELFQLYYGFLILIYKKLF